MQTNFKSNGAQIPKICAHEGKDLEDVTMYLQLVGSLIYVTLTRLDSFLMQLVLLP